VLGRNYAGGPSGAELFDLPLVALNTACCCSRRSPTALPCWRCSAKGAGAGWLAVTGLLGGLPVIELYEFRT
jgi:cytochrome o ubiquinol oxidase subunit 3